MAKADIESAFRLLPVHPEDFCLLGFWFEGGYFVDWVLPFHVLCLNSLVLFLSGELESGLVRIVQHIILMIFFLWGRRYQCDRLLQGFVYNFPFSSQHILTTTSKSATHPPFHPLLGNEEGQTQWFWHAA